MIEAIGPWIAVLCVLMVLSLLWRENPAYRLAEHLMIGLTAGFAFATTWFQYLKPKWFDPWMASFADRSVTGILGGLFVLLLGLCWYGLYFQRTRWLMRVVLGAVIGAGAGQAIRNNFTQQMPVITDSFRSPIVIRDGGVFLGESLRNSVFLIALLSVLVYFFFSFDHKRTLLRITGNMGRIWLMVGFGAYFGNTVMTRMSVFIERIWFVVEQFQKAISR